MDSNPAAFCQRRRSTQQVSELKKTQTNLSIFPLSSCEPDCSAAVWFRSKPLRFPTGGLFSSTLRVKRQAPPLPCFVLDKKLTIPCCYCGCRLECRSGCLRGQYGWPIFAGRLVGLAGCAVKGYTPGDSCGPNPRRLYCARCKQGV